MADCGAGNASFRLRTRRQVTADTPDTLPWLRRPCRSTRYSPRCSRRCASPGNDACLGARKELFAGLPCSRSRDSGRPVATLMRRLVLRIDALFLTVAGVFGLVSDLQSYASGRGPFGQTFYHNPTVSGVVEAHGLAVLTAGTLWFLATHHTGHFGHWLRLSPMPLWAGATSFGSRCSRASRRRLKGWQSRWCILASSPLTHFSSSSEPAAARIEGPAGLLHAGIVSGNIKQASPRRECGRDEFLGAG